MKDFILALAAFVLLILETVICRYIGISNAYPELVFAFVICIAVLDDNLIRVSILSCVCGFLLDCLNGGPVGVNMICFGVTAVLSSFFTSRFFVGNFFVAVVCMIISSFLSRFMIFLFGFVIFGDASMSAIFFPLIVKYVIYDTAAVMIMYPIFYKMLYARRMYDRR